MKKILLSIASLALSHSAFSQWTTSGSNIYNSNSGNIGIGTTTPLTTLDVKLATNQHIQFAANVNGLVPGVPGLVAINDANSAYTAMGFYAGGYIFGGGNMGIGTSSPIGKLDLRGNLFVGTTDLAIGTNGSFIQIDQGAATGNTYTQLRAFSNGGNAYNNLVLQNGGGNVGIGTTNPDSKLTVNGTVHSKSVVVDMSIFADYVFHPKYMLPSLSSVDAYVKKYQHLPEIPSEQEVIKNGLDLGQMNNLLVKKVEELTLYMIEKDKQLKQQQRINQLQDQRLKRLERKFNK